MSRIPPQIELRDDCIVIRNLQIRLFEASDYLHQVPDYEHEAACVKAFEMGFFCLQRTENLNDTQFVKQQFNALLNELYQAVNEIPNTISAQLANKIGTSEGQLLAPLQGQINLTTAVMDAQIKAVSDFLNQEFNPSQETSVFGSAVQKIQNLLDENRTDSLQGVFSAAITNITAENSVLAKSVRAVVTEAVKPLADEVEKLAQQVREKELIELTLEQTIAKGASFEEAVVAELEPWAKLYGAEITHIGKDKQPGDILLKFNANSIASVDLSLVIEVRNRDSASWGRKRISEQLTKAMMKREANAAIFLSRSREGLAQEIGGWGIGTCEQGQWVATTYESLSLAIQFLIVQQQLASQPTYNLQIDCAVIEAQVQQIKLSLNYLTQINSSLTKLQEHSSDIRAKARAMRTEIRNALNSISESISSNPQR
ncbi:MULTISPECIES: hypothetical protein [unclassified Nostoc]|uniref:hypothetical protein n=1 Tax=unclassified Nostoc TaxID=2593658 RepID=UPI002AD532BC|nr:MULTISPECIES: hypothetical protein [unclassified Nostoc]MDZ8126657.1 hypothetical protein [Nostoc sp. CmiVER01]MDZ8227881.1 hypothetical protein [Nostoc sp. ChiVER01]